MHLEDMDTVRRMVGVYGICEEAEVEYDIRLRMYHASGAQGPLGALHLIPLLRQFGYKPNSIQEADQQPNWNQIPTGTRVNVLHNGKVCTGNFVAQTPQGTLAVTVDGDLTMREHYSCEVCLLGSKLALASPGPGGQRVETEAVDWRELPEGTPVKVNLDGAYKPAVLVKARRMGRGYTITVRIDGEDQERMFTSAQVFQAGA